MDVEAINHPAQLESLRLEWTELWELSPVATPFQHPGWLLPWWNVFGSGELFSFAVRERGRLVALAPLFLHPWNDRRQVTFLGNGVSDYLNIVSDPEWSAPACSAILAAVADQRQRWDLCDLQDLSQRSSLIDPMVPAALQSTVQPQSVCNVIDLPQTVEQFQEGLPHGLRRNLRRYRSQLEAEGPVAFKTAGQCEYGEHLEALFALHRARWEQRGDPGMLSSPGVERFHRAAASNLCECGVVRLHALRFKRAIAAVVYALVHRGRAYSYLGGFDPALARFSPGALIMQYTIEQAIREGIREFDFLRGRESYKSDWGAKPEVTSRLVLWHGERPADVLQASVA